MLDGKISKIQLTGVSIMYQRELQTPCDGDIVGFGYITTTCRTCAKYTNSLISKTKLTGFLRIIETTIIKRARELLGATEMQFIQKYKK